MTKKHFIALADMIKQCNSNEFNKYIGDAAMFSEYQVEKLAEFCLSVNPRFNRERWVNYISGKCGKNGGKVKQNA